MTPERLAELDTANADGKLWSADIVGELLEYVGELKHNLRSAGECIDTYVTACARGNGENERLTQRIRELEDRVLANIDARGDAEDLRRENADLRAQLADAPTSEAAIAKLREWSASAGPTYEYGPGATHIAMSVAMARKILDEIDGLNTDRDQARAIARNALHIIDNEYRFKELRYTLDEPGWTIPGLDAENYPVWLIDETPTEGDTP